MATVSLGMIVRNEGRTLERCLLSVKDHVDEIVIGLAGESTDDTAEIARKYATKVLDVEWQDDFSEARNAVLAQCTGEYYLWLDGDDELLGLGALPLKELIVRHPEIDAFYWGYDYARDEHDVNVCFLIRERLIKLSPEWKWMGTVHEVFTGPPEHSRMLVNELVVKHNKPVDKHNPWRNLELLYKELEQQEPNPDPRILAYLGSENAIKGNLREAINYWNRFVKLSGWDEEKYQSQHKIADCWRALGEFEKSREAEYRAISILPSWPDSYFGLAETAYRLGEYPAAIEWTKTGSTKKRPETMLIINPRDYDYDPLLILGLAYTQLGDFEMALENFHAAYQVRPDQSVAKQVAIISEEARLHKVVDAAMMVWEELGRNDEWLKARQLFDLLPRAIMMAPPIDEARIYTFESTAHVEQPELMEEFYLTNPHWVPMEDEQILSEGWLAYPRLRFALDTARAIRARSIVDLGCSDGFISLPIARELSPVPLTGVDLDPRCIELANRRASDWGLTHATFITGDVNSYQPDGGTRHSLALLFEVLEHVVDPEATLQRLESIAEHIAITTPYLAWDRGNPVGGWKEPGLKGHLRVFDTDDLERMLAPRGRIRSLYHEPVAGQGGWIFADYQAGVQTTGKRISIAALGSLEAWSPVTYREQGLGGSETAVIRVAEELAARNHDVTVFADTDRPGYHNWVRYRTGDRYYPSIPADLFIAWRAPELIDQNPNAKARVLWMHDTDAGDRLTPERAAGFDKIIVLSEWHKEFMLEKYPFLHGDQLLVIPNGVDLERFLGDENREPHRVVYASSPDRGLDVILEGIWPTVVEAVPDAQLHVYYGWDSYDKAMERFPHLRDFKSRLSGTLLNSKNVTQHGRLPQDKLAKEFQKSDIWLYPTYFPETYCITAVEAQLAGCIPITRQLAALKETCKSGVFINGDVLQPEVQEAFAKAVIKTMQDKDREKLREGIRKNAPQATWADVASAWETNWLEVDHAS